MPPYVVRMPLPRYQPPFPPFETDPPVAELGAGFEPEYD
jgi:hypothetical protein